MKGGEVSPWIPIPKVREYIRNVTIFRLISAKIPAVQIPEFSPVPKNNHGASKLKKEAVTL